MRFKKNLAASQQHYTPQQLAYAIAGIFFSAFGLESFLVPNGFLDGGMTGVALIINAALHSNHLSLIVLLTNVPWIFLGAYAVSRQFAIRLTISILVYSAILWLVHFPVVTHDKLLVSAFGGFFLGIGVGLAIRGGVALDGIEVLALYTIRRSSFKIGEVILAINIVVFAISGLFFKWEIALYAMLTYFIATRTVHYVVEGLNQYTGVTIISAECDIIKERLVKEFGKGITIYKGERGFLKDSFEVSAPCDIIFTVVTRFEVRPMRLMVKETDPKAFIFTHAINEIAGGVLKKNHGEQHA